MTSLQLLQAGSAETEIVDDDLVIRGQMSEDHIDDCSTSPRRLQVDTSVAVRNSSTTKVFPEPRLCKAIVDRLTFNAHIVETGTESWRFKKTMERQQRKGVRRKTA